MLLTTLRGYPPFRTLTPHTLAVVAAGAHPVPEVTAFSGAALDASSGGRAPREQRGLTSEAVLSGVVRSMGRRQNNNKVLGAIVGAVEVAVMDVLIAFKRAAQHLSHNDTMLANVAALISHRVIGLEQVNVPVLLDAPAFVPAALSATLPFIGRRLALVGCGITGTGTEYTANYRSGSTFNGFATTGTSVCLLHVPSIPQTADYINTQRSERDGKDRQV